MLSDRIGRRPVILMGTAGAMTSILLFGLSKSFAWALVSRSLCGLLVSNDIVHLDAIIPLTQYTYRTAMWVCSSPWCQKSLSTIQKNNELVPLLTCPLFTVSEALSDPQWEVICIRC